MGQGITFGSVFTECVVGILCMGVVGDLVGRRRGLALTVFFAIFGVVGSAAVSWPGSGFWHIIAVCRFISGVGIGGTYPLSATLSAEGKKRAECSAEVVRNQQRVGWRFWQMRGMMAPYFVALALVSLQLSPMIDFRLVIAFGALPLVPTFLNMCLGEEGAAFKENRTRSLQTEVWNREYWWTVLGTGGSWFLFDVSYYSIVVFTPFILGNIFGKSGKVDIQLTCLRSIISVGCACLGALGCISLLGRFDVRRMNSYGFLIMGFAFLLLGIGLDRFPPLWPMFRFASLCLFPTSV